MPVVSIVFPVYSEESNLEPLYRCVREALSRVDAEYDMVFVDNGSTDSSLEIIKGLSRRDSRVSISLWHGTSVTKPPCSPAWVTRPATPSLRWTRTCSIRRH